MERTQRGGKNRGGRNWLRIAIAPLAVMSAVALAACGGDSSDDGGDSATAATSGAGGSETVSVESLSSAGDVLVDSSGAALYLSEQEESGKIECSTAECTSIWKPVTIGGGEQPTGPSDIQGDLGTVMRPDGDAQVSFDGAPLYSFTEEGPGEVTGDGFVDTFGDTEFTWHVATPTGASAGGGGSPASQDTGGSLDY